MPRTTRFPNVPGQLHLATVHYDFALDGGAEGEIVLPGQFPAGAVFVIGVCHVLEPLTGDGASAALMLGDAELIPAAAVASWTAGIKVTDVLGAGGFNPALIEEDLHASIVISGADLTAGKVALHMVYLVSPAAPVQLETLQVPPELMAHPKPEPQPEPEPEPQPEPEPEPEEATKKRRRKTSEEY